MVLLFEISMPFRVKPKVERIGGIMTRWIWLWFSVAVFRRCGVNDMARAWRNAGKQELVDAGWRAP